MNCSQSGRKRVLVIQTQMKRYRVPFFEKLYASLTSGGISLRVVYSDPSVAEQRKKDNSDIFEDFADKVPGYGLWRGKCIYQPVLREMSEADLVIVEHANKLLANHILLLLRMLQMKRFAFWGLGSNKQVDRSYLSEWYKRKVTRWADWYFAYTQRVAEEMAANGFPAERISTVQNAVDTRELQQHLASIDNYEVDTFRRKLGIKADDPVGVYCGMLEPVKGVPFLVESAKHVKEQLPRFQLLIVGAGRDESRVRLLAQETPWIHVLGPKFGREKALALKSADVFVMPGRVGLAILDCFAAHLPLLTVKLPIHGPEVEYLNDGINGFMVEQSVDAYTATVIRVLQNPELLHRLREGAKASIDKYSIEAMVENFRRGIVSCLSLERVYSTTDIGGAP